MSEIDSRHAPAPPSERAFTLLELLIVILLLSLFTFLVVGSLKREASSRQIRGIPALRGLPERMNLPAGELVCTEQCKKCVYVGGDHNERPMALSLPPLTAYGIDISDQPRRLEFGRFHDRPICLRFRYYSNGSSSRMILGNGKEFFYLPSYFGEMKSFPSLEAAAEYWLRDGDLLHDRGDYY